MARVRIVLLALLLLIVTGCGGGAGPGAPQTIRVALDWTPNTNHTGLFVALERGWFREAGLDVELLPYNTASPDTLVSTGAAEFGVSFQDSFTFSKAAGADITSVLAVLQHWASAIGVRADRADIVSPRDLDGRTHAGFGGPGEEARMQNVIRNAGGRGEFTSVTLGTAAYEAVYAGQADFVEPFLAWEGIEAQLRGQPFKTFAYADYGLPDSYAVLLVGNSPWLRDNPALAKAFVQAAQRGYQFGADDPAAAAQVLIDANPGTFDPDLARRSQELLAQRYLRDESGAVGTQTLQRWADYSGWLVDQGLLTGPDGGLLAQRPDFATWFDDSYRTP